MLDLEKLREGNYIPVNTSESRRERDRVVAGMRARAKERNAEIDEERERAYWTMMKLRIYR